MNKKEYSDEIISRVRVYLRDKLEQATVFTFDEIQMFAADTRTTNTLVIKAKAGVKYHNDVWIAALAHINATAYPTSLNPQTYVDSITAPNIP